MLGVDILSVTICILFVAIAILCACFHLRDKAQSRKGIDANERFTIIFGCVARIHNDLLTKQLGQIDYAGKIADLDQLLPESMKIDRKRASLARPGGFQPNSLVVEIAKVRALTLSLQLQFEEQFLEKKLLEVTTDPSTSGKEFGELFKMYTDLMTRRQKLLADSTAVK